MSVNNLVQNTKEYIAGIHQFINVGTGSTSVAIPDIVSQSDTTVMTIQNGNVGIGITNPSSTLDVNGTITTSNLVVLNAYSIDYQIAPIRSTSYVESASNDTFVLTQNGYFGGNASNAFVYVDNKKLSYYTDVYNDYKLFVSYNNITNDTVYTIQLTQPATLGQIVDITIWPQILQESLPNPMRVYQRVDVQSDFISTGSNIYYLAGNVGVGTTDTSAGKLVVAGNIVPSACNVYDLGSSNLRWRDLYLSGNTIDLGGTLISRNQEDGGLRVHTDEGATNLVNMTLNRITTSNIVVSGNVGIGTTNPLQPLHIQGDSIMSGNVGIGTTVARQNLDIVGNTLMSGNVGIGTTAPLTPLHIQGNTYISGNFSAGNMTMFRNKIINGNFDIWQRGTSFNVTTSLTYTADRWRFTFDGSGATRTISQQTFTLGQTDVPNEPTYFLRYNQSVAGIGATYNTFQQLIESVRTLAGQTVTVSFYAKADASRSITVGFNQFFGSGGSPSSGVFTTFGTPTLSTNWTKYTVVGNLPSISGKTLGTVGNDCLDLAFIFPINTTFTIDIAQVQVEKGNLATPFEMRPYGVELQLCQRYYQILTNIGASYYNFASSGVVIFRYFFTHIVPMAYAPTNTITETARVSVGSGYPYIDTSSTTTSRFSTAVDGGLRYTDSYVTVRLNAEF